MCKIDWDIIQKFTESLVWPLLVLVIFLIFRRQITTLINRISYESENIEFVGLLKAQLMTIEKIKEIKQAGGQITDEETTQLISTTVHIQLEGIKKLGEDYAFSSFDQRRLIESRIKELSIGLTVSDIKPLLRSPDTGHKIAATIALKDMIYRQKTDPFEDDDLKLFIDKSLDDSNSFLRYEILQLVFTNEKLKKRFRPKLNAMKENDRNIAIRNILNNFLN